MIYLSTKHRQIKEESAMTDRVNSFVVVLEKNMRDDDAQCIANAISHLRGVIEVTANVTNPTDYALKQQIVNELRSKIFEVLK